MRFTGRVVACTLLVLSVPAAPVAMLFALGPGASIASWQVALLAVLPVLLAVAVGPLAWPRTRRRIAVARAAVAETAMWAIPALLGAPLFLAACGSADWRWGAIPAAVVYSLSAGWGVRRAPPVWWAWPVAIALGIAAAFVGFDIGPDRYCST